VLSTGRSLPVTVVGLSEVDLALDGPQLGEIEGAFTVEVAFEADGDSAWNPKASGPQFLHLFTATAMREHDGPVRGAIIGIFTEMPTASRRLLDDFIRQLRSAREARVRGGAIPHPQAAFFGQVDESA
jgi:hypothetical protein